MDDSVNISGAPHTFQKSGQVHHNLGSLVEPSGCKPKFSQLYIYGTCENNDNATFFLWFTFHIYRVAFIVNGLLPGLQVVGLPLCWT